MLQDPVIAGTFCKTASCTLMRNTLLMKQVRWGNANVRSSPKSAGIARFFQFSRSSSHLFYISTVAVRVGPLFFTSRGSIMQEVCKKAWSASLFLNSLLCYSAASVATATTDR